MAQHDHSLEDWLDYEANFTKSVSLTNCEGFDMLLLLPLRPYREDRHECETFQASSAT